MALKTRNEKQLKIKQPVSSMYIVTSKENETAVLSMMDTIKDELNIKKIEFLSDPGNRPGGWA